MEMNLLKMDVMKKKKRKGFTLIELIVVIAIIGILAAIAVPKLLGFQDKARRTQVVTDSHQISTAIQSLLTDSPSGTFAADVAVSNVGSVATDPVVKLSGISPDATPANKTLSYKTDGSFILTEILNNKTYVATGGAGGAAAVVVP